MSANIYEMNPISPPQPSKLDCTTMSQSAGSEDKDSSAPSVDEEARSLRCTPRCAQNGGVAGPHVSAASLYETLFGAIHVDACGIVLEHKPLGAGEASVSTPPMIGRDLKAIARWANEPDFVAALKSAIESAKVSYHFDFKTATAPRERMIHVNILAVGDKTAWIFISDKTLIVY
jgi:hypothetical protein